MKACVLLTRPHSYESIGYIFPEGTEGIRNTASGGFGPIVVPLADFMKLTKLRIQYVWGDHRAESYEYVRQSRLSAQIINKLGGNATVLKLADDAGLNGSTHISFADLDNVKVGNLLEEFLQTHQLDDYEGVER